jgi:CheY-like chemotaxis protein
MTLPLPSGIHLDLIEDNPADAKLIQIGLKEYTHIPLLIRHFPHPLAYLETVDGPPLPGCSLVLTDFNMPYMSGLDLLIKIRYGYSAAELPVFITTGGLLTSADVTACQAAGVSGIVSKPLDPELWRQILETEMLPSLAAWPF